MLSNDVEKMILVGNKFHEYCRKNNAITVNEFIILLQDGFYNVDKRIKVLLGQGVNYEDAQKVLDVYDRVCKDNALIDVSDISDATLSGKNTFTHKYKVCNTIIGHAKKIDELNYLVPLLVDENCELLQDHQTGLHIQGIMIVEAFRQAIVAITEEFLSTQEQNKQMIVVNYINTTYDFFIFPLPTNIILKVLKKELIGKRAKFLVRLEAWQNDEPGASCECEYQLFPSSIMTKTEAKMAFIATNKTLR